LAEASTLVRAFSVAMMPALATLTVCCSITSCSCAQKEKQALHQQSAGPEGRQRSGCGLRVTGMAACPAVNCPRGAGDACMTEDTIHILLNILVIGYIHGIITENVLILLIVMHRNMLHVTSKGEFGKGNGTMERAESDILSNSSMQQMPRSLSTSAPLSSTISFVSCARSRERPLTRARAPRQTACYCSRQ
jgi:hypothetical protein